jgi:hypothetical protein
MRRTMQIMLVIAATLGLGYGLLESARPALAAKNVTIEACVVDRKPTAALMDAGDKIYFEVGLSNVLNSPYNVKVDDCFKIQGLDRDNEPGINRQYPQGGWYVEAYSIDDPADHVNKPRRTDKDEDKGGSN